MAKKQIFVGLEYKDAFDAICALIKNNCFEGSSYSVIEGVISDGEHDFHLSTKKGAENAKQKFLFEKDGATWFNALRGQKTPDDDAVWNTFRSNLIIEYHKRFSVMEFMTQPPTAEERTKSIKLAEKIANNFVATFYPDLKGNIDVKALSGSTTEDLYGVALKIELSGGTGATLPALAKVYFTRSNKNLIPMKAEASYLVDQNIQNLIPEETENTRTERISLNSAIIDQTLNALGAIIEGSNQNQNFADYLCFSEQLDFDLVNGLLSKLANDESVLECHKVDVLYISHVQANAFDFIISFQNTPRFNLRVGINNDVSLSCINCGDDEPLIERNQIYYVNEEGVKVSQMLSFEKENCGISEPELSLIKNTSSLAKHCHPVNCPGKTTKGCNSYKCLSQLFTVDNGGEKHGLTGEVLTLCKDCPYPELVYTTPTGEKKFTPNLYFAFDLKALVDNVADEPLVKCSTCGRYFTSKSVKGKKCALCQKADESVVSDDAKALYKKYKNFLPLFARFTFTKNKGAYEDEEIILFVVGKKQYLFNKLNAKEFGYISKPKKIK